MLHRLLTAACLAAALLHANNSLADPDGVVDRANVLMTQLKGAWVLYRNRQYDRALEQATRILGEYEQLDFTIGIAESHFTIGVIQKKLAGIRPAQQEALLNQSIDNLTRAVDEYMSIMEYVQASKAVYDLGKAHHGKGDLVSACLHSKRAIALYKSQLGLKKTFVNHSKYKDPTVAMQRYAASVCQQH